jgi:hypothetical protein
VDRQVQLSELDALKVPRRDPKSLRERGLREPLLRPQFRDPAANIPDDEGRVTTTAHPCRVGRTRPPKNSILLVLSAVRLGCGAVVQVGALGMTDGEGFR